MNEELTNEALEAVVNCDDREECIGCPAQSVCAVGRNQALAAALLEERAKPKVWDGAPLQSTRAAVTFYGNGKRCGIREHTRELPKTRARQIAEQEGQGLAKKYGWSVAAGALVANVVESALTKYAEELTKKETN
jgi:hypothetical protein